MNNIPEPGDYASLYNVEPCLDTTPSSEQQAVISVRGQTWKVTLSPDSSLTLSEATAMAIDDLARSYTERNTSPLSNRSWKATAASSEPLSPPTTEMEKSSRKELYQEYRVLREIKDDLFKKFTILQKQLQRCDPNTEKGQRRERALMQEIIELQKEFTIVVRTLRDMMRNLDPKNLHVQITASSEFEPRLEPLSPPTTETKKSINPFDKEKQYVAVLKMRLTSINFEINKIKSQIENLRSEAASAIKKSTMATVVDFTAGLFSSSTSEQTSLSSIEDLEEQLKVKLETGMAIAQTMIDFILSQEREPQQLEQPREQAAASSVAPRNNLSDAKQALFAFATALQVLNRNAEETMPDEFVLVDSLEQDLPPLPPSPVLASSSSSLASMSPSEFSLSSSSSPSSPSEFSSSSSSSPIPASPPLISPPLSSNASPTEEPISPRTSIETAQNLYSHYKAFNQGFLSQLKEGERILGQYKTDLAAIELSLNGITNEVERYHSELFDVQQMKEKLMAKIHSPVDASDVSEVSRIIDEKIQSRLQLEKISGLEKKMIALGPVIVAKMEEFRQLNSLKKEKRDELARAEHMVYNRLETALEQSNNLKQQTKQLMLQMKADYRKEIDEAEAHIASAEKIATEKPISQKYVLSEDPIVTEAKNARDEINKRYTSINPIIEECSDLENSIYDSPLLQKVGMRPIIATALAKITPPEQGLASNVASLIINNSAKNEMVSFPGLQEAWPSVKVHEELTKDLIRATYILNKENLKLARDSHARSERELIHRFQEKLLETSSITDGTSTGTIITNLSYFIYQALLAAPAGNLQFAIFPELLASPTLAEHIDLGVGNSRYNERGDKTSLPVTYRMNITDSSCTVQAGTLFAISNQNTVIGYIKYQMTIHIPLQVLLVTDWRNPDNQILLESIRVESSYSPLIENFEDVSKRPIPEAQKVESSGNAGSAGGDESERKE